MKFCLDNSLPVRNARALNEMVQPDHTIVHLRDKFGPTVIDESWIVALGKEGGWIVISADYRIDRNAYLRRAWRESGLIVFFLTEAWTKIPPLQQHSKLALILDSLVQRAERAAPGCSFSVSLTGKIS